MVSAIIVDLDDCLFDSRHLNKYLPKKQNDREAWDKFQEKYSDCKINRHILILIDALRLNGITLLFVTGREATEKLKELTEERIRSLYPDGGYYKIFFRAANDYRKASEVKQEIYRKYIKGQYDVLFAIDDDIENINMFAKEGLNVMHCKYGKKVKKNDRQNSSKR